jgi:hypothetical protein
MSRTTWFRGALLGAAVAGSLTFGAAQALARPASAARCDLAEQVPASCTNNLTSCNAPCASIGYFDGGFCSGGTCCTCKT